MKNCAREGCENTFTPKTHNQRYCDSECCRLATNKRMTAKYHERQARKKGVTRICASCKTTKLSRYNSTRICGACASRTAAERNGELAKMLANVTAA